MNKLVPVLIFTLFFKSGQAQLDLSFLSMDCKFSPEGAANLCEAFKTKLPTQPPELFPLLCPCIEGFFAGKSDLCIVTKEPFHKIPQCYQLLSSVVFKALVDGSKANPLYAAVINFIGHNLGVCATQDPPPTVNSSEKSIAFFFGNNALLELLGTVVKAALGDDAGLLMSCVWQVAAAINTN